MGTLIQKTSKGGRIGIGGLSVPKDRSGWFGFGNVLSRVSASVAQLLALPTWDATGKLIPGDWVDGRSSDILLPDHEGQNATIGGDHLPYEGARWVDNLWPTVDVSDTPTTQTITVVSGNEYQLQIGAGSASGATAVCSGAFTGTLTGDATDIQSWASGTPKTAGSTSLTVTISGSVADIQLEDVTGKTNQNPSEYQTVGLATGAELQANDYSIGVGGWAAYGANELENDDGTIHVTYVDNLSGAYLYFREALDLTEDLVIGATYALSIEAKVNTGQVGINPDQATFQMVTETDWTEKHFLFTATSATHNHVNLPYMGAGEEIWLRNFSLMRVSAGVAAYNRTNPNQVDALGVVTDDATQIIFDKKLTGVIVGDSIANPAYGTILDDYVKDGLGAVVSFDNNAVPGRVFIGSNSVDSHFNDDTEGYDIVIIQGGVNTVVDAGSDPTADMLAAVARMVAVAEFRGQIIRVMGMTPWKGWGAWSADVQTWTENYNAGLLAVYTDRFIDAYAPMEDSSNADYLEPTYSHDELHHNATGQAKFGDLIIEALPTYKYRVPVLRHVPGETNIKAPWSAELSQSAGSVSLNFTPLYDAPDTRAAGRIVSLLGGASDGLMMYANVGSDYVLSYDGVNVGLSAISEVDGDEIHLVNVFGPDGFKTSVKQITWDHDSLLDYDGSFANGFPSKVALFEDWPYSVEINSFEWVNDFMIDDQIEARYTLIIPVLVYLADFSDLANSFLIGAV